jgi:D-arabinose 1-dehydrogenase-like Zn-dependent alcohol dehydrogenase
LERPDLNLLQRFQIKGEHLFVVQSGKQLQTIAQLFESGKVRVPIMHLRPLEEAAQAIEEIRQGHTTGKIVLTVSGSAKQVMRASTG